MNKLNCFSLTTEGQVAHLVMNRPEAMNTMHPTFWRELHEVLTDIHKAGTARARTCRPLAAPFKWTTAAPKAARRCTTC
jgi:enoyl-CoA hydratase/carnithine racemase